MPTVEFPRMGTIAQAAAESGVPAYRVRQLCKTGQVRSVQCGRKILVNLSSLAATAARHPPGGVMTTKKPPRCWNTESGKGGNNAAHSFSRLQYIKVWRLMQ